MILGLANELCETSPTAWWELHASIIGKDRAAGYITAPNLIANKMQAEYDEIWDQCLEDGIPCRIVGLKGRQQGSSTKGVGMLYWLSRSRNCKSIIVGDEYDKSIKNLVAMFDTYAETDRFPWDSTYNRPSKTFSNGSILETDTANDARAGASGTYQGGMLTEVAHWPETGKISAKATFAALLSCVPDLPGTYVLVESTPNGIGGAYYDTYQNAISLAQYRECKAKGIPFPKKWNGFFKVFYPWWEHPEYQRAVTPAERQEILDTLTDKERELMDYAKEAMTMERLAWRRWKIASPAFNSDEDRFEKEYPYSETSGFLTSGRRAFHLKSIQTMRKHCKEPTFGTFDWADPGETRVIFRPCEEDEAIVKIWEHPKPGYKYWFPVDPAEGSAQTIGEDTDNHAPCMMRDGFLGEDGLWYPPAMVARLADCFHEKRDEAIACRWDIDVLADNIRKLYAYYGGCPVVPEMNKDRGLCERLDGEGVQVYRRMQRNRVEQTETPMLGWRTDEANRRFLTDLLKSSIRKFDEVGAGVMIWDKLVLDELDTCIIDEKGKLVAMPGKHDDTMMAIGIGLATRAVAQTLQAQYNRRPSSSYDSPPADSTYSL